MQHLTRVLISSKAAYDPEQISIVVGEDGTVGSRFSWQGVAEKSKGHQILTALNENDSIRFDCRVEKPFKGNPIFSYSLTPSENGVTVIQDFELRLFRFAHFMTKIFRVKKKMIKSNP